MADQGKGDGNVAMDAATRWFEREDIRMRPPSGSGMGPGVFEFGLSLGGTVSSGAYTAGVLDFLVEAIDEWTRAQADTAVPQHGVCLSVMAGASGGGVSAAALAKALAYDFPHVRQSDDEATQAEAARRNPLYALWVNELDITGFCQPGEDDLRAGQAVRSLMHPRPLLHGCETVADYPDGLAPPPPTARRDWVSEPLTTFLTLTNLTGVPYRVNFSGQAYRGQAYSRHADYLRLEFYYRDASPTHVSWPDALMVKAHPQAVLPSTTWHGLPPEVRSWRQVAHAARATGAFPVGFPPVQLVRPAWHYLYQPVMVQRPSLDGRALTMHAHVLEPNWAGVGQDPLGSYCFVCVDGGALNNEPIELARRHLSGLLGRNAREAHLASRAVVHIDPFSDPSRPASAEVGSVASTLGATFSTLISHARFSTQDLLLGTDPNAFSRFLLTAVRRDGDRKLEGTEALATSPLAAFSGFLCRAYRHHDFMLGRRNCQQFLKAHFTLDANNPVFGGLGEGVGVASGREIPIIPLCGSAAREQAQPAWPAGAFDPGLDAAQQTQLEALLSQRIRSVGLSFLQQVRWLDRVKLAFGVLFPFATIPVLAGLLIKQIAAALKKHGLTR